MLMDIHMPTYVYERTTSRKTASSCFVLPAPPGSDTPMLLLVSG